MGSSCSSILKRGTGVGALDARLAFAYLLSLQNNGQVSDPDSEDEENSHYSRPRILVRESRRSRDGLCDMVVAEDDQDSKRTSKFNRMVYQKHIREHALLHLFGRDSE